jgi:hypothetical protein
MGAVFHAEDTRLRRACALKVMLPGAAARPGMQARFLREARAAAAIDHEHIIPIYEVDVDAARGVAFIAMPLLKGHTLEAELRQRGGIPHSTGEAVHLARQIAQGLAAAHAAGMVHRDIKPANVWIEPTGGGNVKLLDFGLARLMQGEQDLTHSGMVLGTPTYMAPEQGRGGKVDARADLFSLGVILYRLCTGVLPFVGSDALSTLWAITTHQPPPPAEINPAVPTPLSNLVMKLLEKDPEKRPASAREFLDQLEATEQSGLAVRRSRRVDGLAAAVIILGLLVIAAAGYGLHRLYTVDDGDTPVAAQTNPATPPASTTGVPPATRPAGNGDRYAAERILAAGGEVTITGHPGFILRADHLPPGPIRIYAARFYGHSKIPVDDDFLDCFRDVTGIDYLLNLSYTKVTEKGLAKLASFPGARLVPRLELDELPIGDSGLLTLPQFPNLVGVSLVGTKITDRGLKVLCGLSSLRELDLSACRGVTAAGLAELRSVPLHQLSLRYQASATDAVCEAIGQIKTLRQLHLTGTTVSNEGIARLTALADLQLLMLNETKVTAKALHLLPNWPNLEFLNLDALPVDDQDLQLLHGNKKLRQVDLRRTLVTELGAERLAQHLPNCTINLSNFTIRPKP